MFLAYRNNVYKHGWQDKNFTVEINLSALKVLREINLTAYVFNLGSIIDKFR